jgi:hypothetical protein
MHDLIIKGGLLVDPQNAAQGMYDIAIEDGKIAAVEEDIAPERGRNTLFAAGRVVMPGIFDMHIHTGFTGKGGRSAMQMMARAGTVTALDCGGPLHDFLDFALNHGSGMNLACLQMIKPGWNVSGLNPPQQAVRDLIDASLEQGALGMKILGGHYPITPEGTRRFIEETNGRKAFIAYHLGTTRNPVGNFNAFTEAVELATGHSLDMVHVNSYCRGQVLGDPVAETLQVLAALEAHPNLFSESYLAVFSATPSKCINGEIESNGPKNSLSMGGYEQTERGLRKAILDGFASVVYPRGDANVRLSGPEGIAYFDEQGSDVSCTFPVTPASTRFLLATQKARSGRFIVDALATDGGSIPRNFLVEKGTALVRMDMLSWADYVRKTSINPARILGLDGKGHLAVGADADVSILDGTAGTAWAAISGGRVIMLDGVVVGQGTTVITTSQGRTAIERFGLKCYVTDLRRGWFHAGRPA